MDYMAEERCQDCNALYALVGYRHRCVPITLKRVPLDTPTKPLPADIQKKPDILGTDISATYKYRDPEKRREAVREAVRKHRANAKTDRPPPS